MAVTEDHELGGSVGNPLSLSQGARLSERFIGSVVGALDPASVAACDATAVWSTFDRIERFASNAKTLLAARVEASGSWKRAGAHSPAEYLGRLGGTSTNVARHALENSKELVDLPGISAALRSGSLSNAQVDAIVPAAAADPSAQDRLLALVQTTNITELKAACLRTKAAADPDPDATHQRIRSNRCARTYTDGEGAWNLVARGTAAEGARFESALAPIVNAMFAAARANGEREAREAYAFDALMTFADHDESDAGGDEVARRAPNPRYMGLLHLSLEALVRGAVVGEETCEIVGIGPVPVRIARELLGDAILKLVITKGVDVANVVHLGRGPTAAQRVALLWAQPKCSNVECSRMFVEIDHRDPWHETKHTTLGELDPLCGHDHDLKTNQNWALVEGKARRAFVPPSDPRHPRNRPPP